MDKIYLSIREKFRNTGFLGGPYSTKFTYNNIDIEIAQSGIRHIVLSTPDENRIEYMCEIFVLIERFLQVFDGQFLEAYEVGFFDEKDQPIEKYNHIKEKYFSNRLSYFESEDIYQGSYSMLCNGISYLNEKNLKNWSKIQQDLDIIHQLILYFTADNHIPTEVRLSVIIQIFEPLSDYVPKISRNNRTCLKECIKYSILEYGKDIFKKEIKADVDRLAQLLKNSRVRILHAIPSQNNKQDCITGDVCVAYCAKLVLLYRIILFDLLNIKKKDYKVKLTNAIKIIDNWQNLIKNFVKTELK